MWHSYFSIFSMTQGNVGFGSAGEHVLVKMLISILVLAALTRHEHSILITAKMAFFNQRSFKLPVEIPSQ